MKKAWLVLANGDVLEGESFGAEGTSIGEVVFTTGMTGYQEILTDPSYYGQIVTQTYPLIGNYGINFDDMESPKSWVSGYVVREWCETPSNFRSAKTIDTFLKEQNVIAICGINTRKLTKLIRDNGVMAGAITTEYDENNKEQLLKAIADFKVVDAVKNCTVDQYYHYEAEDAKHHVVLMDFGYKRTIRASLLARGCNVTVVPGTTSAKEVLALNPDGILLSNGAGDPAESSEIIANVKELMQSGVPVFGICMGHQLAALAMGCTTSKLKSGHRGNQPAKDIDKDRIYITSQNHGYTVDSGSLDESVGYVSHININDGTVEGIRYTKYPCFTVQFHPEASVVPQDTSCLFDEFVNMMKGEH